MIDATAFADYLQVHCHLMSQSMQATVQALNRLHPKVICIRLLTTDVVRKWMEKYNLMFVAAEKKGSRKQFSKYTVHRHDLKSKNQYLIGNDSTELWEF